MKNYVFEKNYIGYQICMYLYIMFMYYKYFFYK